MRNQAWLDRLEREGTPLTEKECRHCDTWKPIAEFPANRKVSDGLSSWCRACHREGTQAWRRANPEKVVAYRRAYAERAVRERTISPEPR